MTPEPKRSGVGCHAATREACSACSYTDGVAGGSTPWGSDLLAYAACRPAHWSTGWSNNTTERRRRRRHQRK
jgi:hypothetical protein